MNDIVPDSVMADAFECLWTFQPKTHWCSTKDERAKEMKAAVAIGCAIMAERKRCVARVRKISVTSREGLTLMEHAVRAIRNP